MKKAIDKNKILEILNDWNFWKQDLETGFIRQDYLDLASSFLTTRQPLVITGARRSGKSFIMRQMIKQLIEKKALTANNTLMVNFEDPRLPKLDAQDLEQIYELYLEKLEPQKQPYIFLDEVQEVGNWEKWVRTAHELNKAKVVISGSNANLLSQELATLLTGRHLDMTVSPLSFKEFLYFKGFQFKDELDLVNQRIKVNRFLNQYLKFGAFPEVTLSAQKQNILLSYFDDILNKDLIKRYSIRKIQAIKGLTRFYLTNLACPITFNSLSKFLGISTDTVEKFSGYLEQAYLISLLPRFSFKVKEQEKSPRKAYAVDVGLANVVGFKFSQNIGKIAENVVFLELKRRQALSRGTELYYWKDEQHREVDFVLKKMKIKQLIQVCWDMEQFKTKERETRALVKASKELKCSNLLIITSDKDGQEKIKGKTIKFIPLWKWLLSN